MHLLIQRFTAVGAGECQIHLHVHVKVRIQAAVHGVGGSGEQSPVRLDLLGNGLGCLGVHGAAFHQALEQIGTAVLEIRGQSLIRHGSEIIPQESPAKHGSIKQALGNGKLRCLGIVEILAVLIAQRPQQKHRVLLGTARGCGAEGGGAGAVGQAVGVQPSHIRGGKITDIRKGMGDGTCLVVGSSLLLCTVEPYQHNGGFGAGGRPIQLKARLGAAEHADGGQIFCRSVKIRRGGSHGQRHGQQQHRDKGR